MKTNLEKLTRSAPLYCRYPGQSEPQDAYIEIHPDGRVFYESNSEIGNAVPVGVWHGTIRRIPIPNDLTPDGYQKLHQDIAPLIQRVIDGLDSEWNGSNHVGTLSDDAKDAEDDLEEICSDAENHGYARCMIVDAEDWLQYDKDITADSDPDEILAACRCNIGGDFADIHIEGLEKYLQSLES